MKNSIFWMIKDRDQIFSKAKIEGQEDMNPRVEELECNQWNYQKRQLREL